MKLPSAHNALSPREHEILLLAADGQTDKEICRRLQISQSTISTYWGRLREKLGASSRSEAIAKALASAYQQSLDELRLSQLWLELFIEAADDYAIFATDLEGVIQTWNPGVLRLLGFRDEEFIGQSIDMLFTPADLAQDAPVKERLIAADTGRSIDDRWHLRRDRVRLWCAGSLFALRDSAGDLRWFAKILRDDTVHRQLIDELDSLRTRLEEFLTERSR